MANNAVTIQEVLTGALAPIGGLEATGALVRQMERMTDQMRVLQEGGEAAVDEVKSAGRDKESTRSAIGGTVLTSVGVGLGLTPLILGIAKLFGGGGNAKIAPPLVEFALPEPVRLNAGVSEAVAGGPFAVDYAQGGSPRARATAPPAQITVQVQAMDSRSFLDHSGDIARAVRQAMLESSVLNDVVREA